MNCQHVRQLLGFDRQCEDVDPAERAALKQHLEQCSDCAELAQAERGADEALGAAMRDVAVPAALKSKILQRLATERGAGRWKWSLAGAAVAATLLIAAGGIAWYVQRPINVAQRDLPEFVIKDRSMDEKAVRDYLQTQGLIDAVPRPLNYQYLRDVEVIEFKGRRVAKLSFSRADEFCEAIVLVLPDRDFRTTRLEEDPTSLKVHPDETEPVTHVIMFRGSLHALMRPITAH